MPLGFGIIGAGMISRFHAKALAEVRGARLVACADTAPGRAEAFAAEYG
jgi:predicted dehydrogenase